ncbi:MAG TPA: 30S ribosomal protein S16 [Bacillota bacterium]
MAVKIRLKRVGAKKAPSYRLVVADSRSPRDGRFIEEIGYYDPTREPAVIKVQEDKAREWLAKGAQPSETVKSLFIRAGIKGSRAAGPEPGESEKA